MLRKMARLFLTISIMLSSVTFANAAPTSVENASMNSPQSGGTTYPDDLSDKFQETTIFSLDNVCRINRYFTDDHMLTTPANCSVPAPITFETNGVRFDGKGGVIFDLQDLKNSDGTPLTATLGSFYKIEVVLEDAGQQDVMAAVSVLDSLWENPSSGGPKGMTMGILNDQYTYWFDSTQFHKPLDADSDTFLTKFIAAQRILPQAPETVKDTKIEIYVSPNGTYPVINGVNYGSFPNLQAGSFTFEQAALRYIVLAKWDTGTTPVKLKELSITNLDDQINSVDEVNAFFIQQRMENMAVIPVSDTCNFFYGDVGFINYLWKAFLYRGYDYYFGTDHVSEVREQVDSFLNPLEGCMDSVMAFYETADTPQEVFTATHVYVNQLQSTPPIMYAISGYLRYDQLNTFQSQFARLIDASMDHMDTESGFPPDTENTVCCESDCFTDDTFAEEISWLLVLYSGYHALYPDDQPRADKIEDYLTFLGYHHLSDGHTIAEEYPDVTFTYLGPEYRTFRSRYTYVEDTPSGPVNGFVDNHHFHPSLNYSMGVVGSAAVARSILNKRNVTIDTLPHNMAVVYEDSVVSYLNTNTFRHSQVVPNTLASSDVISINSDIVIDFRGFSTPSGLEDWTSTFTAYSVLENYGDYTRSLQLARNVYYNYYPGAGKLFCDHNFSDGVGCTASPDNFFTALFFADALYTMAFSPRTSFDADSMNFSADVINGTAPLTVTFTSVTSGTVEGWSWTFGDSEPNGSGAVVQHVYQTPGNFDVSLTADNTYSAHTITKSNYITVTAPITRLQADFSGTPRSGNIPLEVQFTSITTGEITSYAWAFGDGVTASIANPTHTYQSANSFDVTLVVTGPEGTAQAIKPGYIAVSSGGYRIYLPLVLRH